MRFFTTILAALLQMVIPLSSKAATDAEHHVLVSQWKRYYDAERRDCPEEMISALEAIRQESCRLRLDWDYYDATEKWVSAKIAQNWKSGPQARSIRDRDYESYDSPVITFLTSGILSQDNLQELEKTCNPGFHYALLYCGGFSELLIPEIRSDYEFALWYMAARNADYALLQDYYAGRYPQEAVVRYLTITSGPDTIRRKALEDMRERYRGKAASLLASESLLEMRFRTLCEENASEDSFRALYDECAEFERNRSSFRGKEKLLLKECNGAKSLMATLSAKTLTGSVQDGVLTVLSRNVGEVAVSVHKEDSRKQVFACRLRADKLRFYKQEEFKLELPPMDDGSYNLQLTAGGCDKQELTFTLSSLSVAIRATGGKSALYVADYKTGRPVDTCMLSLYEYRGKQLLATATYRRALTYAPLPDDIRNVLEASPDESFVLRAHYVDASGFQRTSRDCVISQRDNVPSAYNENDELHCSLLLDRSVARPGETLSFKLILYSGTAHRQACPGKKIKVSLTDPDNRTSSMILTTGSMSSADGKFVLGHTEKMGPCRLKVSDGDKYLAGAVIEMMDGGLPSFDLKWDKCSENVLPGDTFSISGRICSFSGHPLPEDACSYSVSSSGKLLASGKCPLAPDGSFELTCQSSDELYAAHTVTFTVTDANGETREFTHRVMSVGLPALRFDIKETSPGCINGDLTDGIVCAPYLKLETDFESMGLDRKYRDKLDMKWLIVHGRDTLMSSEYAYGESLSIDIASLPYGDYDLVLRYSLISDSGKSYANSSNGHFWKLDPLSDTLPDGVESLVYVPDMNERRIIIGSSSDPLYVVADLVSSGGSCPELGLVRIGGDPQECSSQFYGKQLCSIDLSSAFPGEDIMLNVLGFKKSESINWKYRWECPAEKDMLPLSFVRLQDTMSPGGRSLLQLQSVPGVECAITVYDQAMQLFRSNEWHPFAAVRKDFPSYRLEIRPGCSISAYPRRYVRALSTMAKSAAPMSNDAMEIAPEQIHVREDFSSNLLWAPALLTDENGLAELTLKASDRLSTYIVQVFAHDAELRSAVLNGSVTVTIPVRLSYTAPSQLYSSSSSRGDSCSLAVGLTNASASECSGILESVFYQGSNYRTGETLGRKSASVSVGAGRVDRILMPLPDNIGDLDSLGVLLRFVPSELQSESAAAGDAVFFTIALRRPRQIVKESHSALLLPGGDRASLESQLRSLMTDFPPESARINAVSIRQMLDRAIPDIIEPRSEDAVSLSASLYALVISRRLASMEGKDAVWGSEKRLLDCLEHCFADGGGVSWFAGMEAMPLVTALVLERISALESLGYQLPERLATLVDKSVRYLDSCYFRGKDSPYMRLRGLTLEKYLYVRSLYADVPLDRSLRRSEPYSQFRQAARAYLAPTGRRGLDGAVILKARRALTVGQLTGSAYLKSLALHLTDRRMLRSCDADLASLEQYMQPHWSGGRYCPNAVSPWRGLLESELYAHTLLCRLFGRFGKTDIADDIRLWIMVQKESQKWDSDPAFVDALACVFDGSGEMLDSQVIVAEAEGELAFDSIKASGNDMSIRREWSVVRGGEEYVLAEGDSLCIGDKVIVKYKIWNMENRSFGHIRCDRPSCMIPLDPVSGITRGGVYRSVLADHTDFWMEVLPEEHFSVSEEFYVGAAGAFVCPAASVESCYAPHYRANDEANHIFCVRESEK